VYFSGYWASCNPLACGGAGVAGFYIQLGISKLYPRRHDKAPLIVQAKFFLHLLHVSQIIDQVTVALAGDVNKYAK
jgi:hypothetical protein